ncbi:MAG TPA: hypothetical protein VJP76_04625 [Candidatus Tumulicola sp.]|nr:hypothetical protein [Candidatus Tumulicola sp.]
MHERRTELHRYLIIFALTAPAAAVVWLVFHGVFATLRQTELAMGYVDPTTQMGIDLGYVAMVGGSLIFGAIALWAAARATIAWLHARDRG